MTLNFQSVGVTLAGSGATVTRFVDVGVRADEVGVLLGEDKEPRDVLVVEMVTPLSVDARPAALELESDEDVVRDERGRIFKLIRFSGSTGDVTAGADRFVFPKGVSLPGEKNDVRDVVVDFPFFCGVEVDPVVRAVGEGSVSMLSSVRRPFLRTGMGSMSPEFRVRLVLFDMCEPR